MIQTSKFLSTGKRLKLTARSGSKELQLTDVVRHISLSFPTGAARGEEGLSSDALACSSL